MEFNQMEFYQMEFNQMEFNQMEFNQMEFGQIKFCQNGALQRTGTKEFVSMTAIKDVTNQSIFCHRRLSFR